ncbi:uncharacterized protein LOC135366239 [Ornithodoros turicata]|uniref:uncharacterized protein LOC135366239 n=1 Tax=Ornithodoros turicata TaxID=34597 RepID=UPI0031398E51
MSMSDRSRRHVESESEYESSELTDEWVRSSDGGVPRHAMVGGQNLHGEPFYIARVNFRGNLLPGKLLPSARLCFVSLDQAEYSSSVYEVLTRSSNLSYHWVRMGGCVIPRNAIVGGRTAMGELIYVGRHMHKGELTPGKIIPSHRCIYVPYLGKEIRYRDFEVLIQGEYPFFDVPKRECPIANKKDSPAGSSRRV